MDFNLSKNSFKLSASPFLRDFRLELFSICSARSKLSTNSRKLLKRSIFSRCNPKSSVCNLKFFFFFFLYHFSRNLDYLYLTQSTELFCVWPPIILFNEISVVDSITVRMRYKKFMDVEKYEVLGVYFIYLDRSRN